MKLKQLEYFLKVVDCGSITKAAHELYISQPSMTKAIVNLEEEYKLQLLVRKPRGVELTENGKKFAYYAKNVLAATCALEENFKNVQLSQRSRLFIATQQLDFVHELFYETYKQNCDHWHHYNLVETDRNDVTRKVLNGDVDIGLLVRNKFDARTFLVNAEAKRLYVYPVDRAGIYAAVGPLSPYYNRQTITFSEAEKCPQIVLDMESQANRNLYFDNPINHFNTEKIVFVNSIHACETFLQQTDALLYLAKWTMGYFRNSAIRILTVLMPGEPLMDNMNELLVIKRVGEPLSLTEYQFLQMIYARFGKKEAFNAILTRMIMQPENDVYTEEKKG